MDWTKQLGRHRFGITHDLVFDDNKPYLERWILWFGATIRLHKSARDHAGAFIEPDTEMSMEGEPGHDALCAREQAFMLKAIREDLDLTDHMEDALNSMRIVAAADESYKTGKTVEL